MTEKSAPESKSLAKAYLDLTGIAPARDALRRQGRLLAEIMESAKIRTPDLSRLDSLMPPGEVAYLAAPPRPLPPPVKPDRTSELIENQGRTNELLAEQNEHLASQVGILSEQVEVQRAAAESARKDTRTALGVAIGFGILGAVVGVVSIIATVLAAG